MQKLSLIFIFLNSFLQASKIDFVVYSYDRPLQLYALLESMQLYLSDGVGVVSVIYRVSNNDYDNGYNIVKRYFPWVNYKKQGKKPQADFKPLVMESAFSTPNEYVSFVVDDIVVKDYVDLSACIGSLKSTDAYCFLLRLGKNTTKCYTVGIDQSIPIHLSLVDKKSQIYKWQFKNGIGDWNYPSNNDMTIYRKKDVITDLESIDKVNFTNTFYEPYWCTKTSRELYGLCFESSKIVNLCINIVQLEQPSHAQFSKDWESKIEEFSPIALLRKFNQGYKIDISDLFKINNISAHIEYAPKFIIR